MFVAALTGADFWLWNWSLSAGHDVLALASGLTLVPLAAASFLALVLSAARLASRRTWRSDRAARPRRAKARRRPSRSAARRTAAPRLTLRERELAFDHDEQGEGALAASSAERRVAKPARKLAA